MPAYDVAIIGAGVCGCSCAHILSQAGKRVVLIDKEGLASGGSGAAGAFISPKFSKAGPLKELMENAYLYALAFYHEQFPECFHPSAQLHLAKFDDENEKVRHFKQETELRHSEVPEAIRALLSDEARQSESIYLDHSGIVDAQAVCQAMASGVDLQIMQVEHLERADEEWLIGPLRAKHVILATGAFTSPVKEPFITLRPIWGHRIDIRTSTRIPAIIHSKVSIAPTDSDGMSAIGATHDVHYHPEKSQDVYDIQRGREELLDKALSTVMLESVEIIRDYTGLRSGSNDYYPIIGKLPDAEASLSRHPELAKGVKTDPAQLIYHPDLYMINGTGGYGFVLAPLLAKTLCESIVGTAQTPTDLRPERFLYRWAKRQNHCAGR